MTKNVRLAELVAGRTDKFLQEMFKVANGYFVELFDSVEKMQETLGTLAKGNYANEREGIMSAINNFSQQLMSIQDNSDELVSLQKDITSMKKTINTLETKVLSKTKKGQK